MTPHRLLVVRTQAGEVMRVETVGLVTVEVFEIYDWAGEGQPMYVEKPRLAFTVDA